MRIHNSLTGRVEEFVPLEPGKVRMYNCGPTVYKRAHIGNFRAFLTADLLRRALEYLGFEVAQVMNITDVGHLTVDDVADAAGEDKLQEEAGRRGLDPWAIAREEERNFKEDLAVLRIRPAHGERQVPAAEALRLDRAQAQHPRDQPHLGRASLQLAPRRRAYGPPALDRA